MQQTIILESNDALSIVKITNGELDSYLKNGEELIHQKGAPGWINSDTEMFPIIGPTASNNFKVTTPKGECIQDQHGILRELTYNLQKTDKNIAAYTKSYTANNYIKNSNYPIRSSEKEMFWPYDFKFYKYFELTNESLMVSFEIDAEFGMPFMFGYHPAFKLTGNKKERCVANNQEVNLQKILDVGGKALPFLNTNEINLIKESGYHINIKTLGFNHFMMWTEVTNMLCIEPITAYPYTGSKLTSDLFNIAKEKTNFKVIITPYI